VRACSLNSIFQDGAHPLAESNALIDSGIEAVAERWRDGRIVVLRKIGKELLDKAVKGSFRLGVARTAFDVVGRVALE